MKQTILLAFSIVAAALFADTVTWTGGAGDNKYFTFGNWSDNWTPVGAPSVDITIDGASAIVEYVPGSDFMPQKDSTFVISNGAKLIQNGGAWPYIYGTLVLDGGTYDAGTASSFRVGENGKLVIKNGGELIFASNFTAGNIASGATGLDFQNGKFTLSGATAEFQPPNGFVNNGVDITCFCYAPAANVVSTFNAGSLTLTRDTADAFYQQPGVFINIPAGSTASFTLPNAAFTSGLYTYCFGGTTPRFRYEGNAINQNDFEDLFTVETIDASHSRFYLTPANAWKLGGITISDVSAASATVSATMSKIGEGNYSVYVACSEDAITTENIVSLGQVITGNEGVYSATFNSLTENTVYNYAFAIVVNGNVEAFKTNSFVASDYAHIYNGTSWVVGGEPTWASSATVLITGTFSTGEINPENKVFKDAVGTVVTLANGNNKPVTLSNASLTNNRYAAVVTQTPYGIWNNTNPVDFRSTSGNGVIKRACSYTCYVTDDQLANFYTGFISNGKLTLEGTVIDHTTYDNSFAVSSATPDPSVEIEDGGTSYSLKQMTITYWEPFPGASGAWTMKSGARAKLDGDVTLTGLVLEDDAILDLNGHNLTVSGTLTIGETVYSAEDTVSSKQIINGGSVTIGEDAGAIGPCGLTAKEAEIAGIDYNGTTQFAIQSTTFDGTKVALTFPGKWAASSYTVKYSTTPDGEMTNCKVVSSKGAESESYGKTNTVTVQLPTDANVVFFHVTRTADQ